MKPLFRFESSGRKGSGTFRERGRGGVGGGQRRAALRNAGKIRDCQTSAAGLSDVFVTSSGHSNSSRLNLPIRSADIINTHQRRPHCTQLLVFHTPVAFFFCWFLRSVFFRGFFSLPVIETSEEQSMLLHLEWGKAGYLPSRGLPFSWTACHC